jgi:hypothetical protein
MLLVSRKVAMTAHPDKGGSEAKMAQVNEAYELLSNPGKQHFIINTFVLLAQLIFTELVSGSTTGMTQTIQALREALRSPDMGVRLVVAVETIRLRSFSSRLGSAGSRLVEAIDDLIFSISQSSLECTVALLHRTSLSRLL